jgi:hypothetical protein
MSPSLSFNGEWIHSSIFLQPAGQRKAKKKLLNKLLDSKTHFFHTF